MYKNIMRYVGIPILLIFAFAVFIIMRHDYIQGESYLESPRSWLTDERVEEGVYVETLAATQGVSYYDGATQQYNDGTVITAFDIVGWFNGTSFSKNFIIGGSHLFHIGPNLIPDNGVMDFFAVSKLKDGEAYVDLFVDSDWIAKYANLNLYWGKETQYAAKLTFQEIKKGVYYAQFKDDTTRFQFEEGGVTQHFNGAYITDATYDELFDNQLEDKIVIKII